MALWSKVCSFRTLDHYYVIVDQSHIKTSAIDHQATIVFHLNRRKTHPTFAGVGVNQPMLRLSLLPSKRYSIILFSSCRSVCSNFQVFIRFHVHQFNVQKIIIFFVTKIQNIYIILCIAKMFVFNSNFKIWLETIIKSKISTSMYGFFLSIAQLSYPTVSNTQIHT